MQFNLVLKGDRKSRTILTQLSAAAGAALLYLNE